MAMQKISLNMIDKTQRGHAIATRRGRMGLTSYRAAEVLAGKMGRTITRGQLGKAERGEVTENMFLLIEGFYDAAEQRLGSVDGSEVIAPPVDPELVTFKLSGTSGVNVTVSGPIANLAELEAAVERLLGAMKDSPQA